MKRLYELLDGLTDKAIMENIRNTFDEDMYDFDGLLQNTKIGIENLKKVNPGINDGVICCVYMEDYDVDFEKTPFYTFKKCDDCFYIDNKSIQEYIDDNNKVPDRYAIEMGMEWDKLLGSYVFIETDKEHDFEYGLATVIQDLMFMGNNNETRKKEMEELNKRLEESQKDGDLSKCYEFDEFMDKMIKWIEEEDKEEAEMMRRHNELFKINEKEIHEINKNIHKENHKHYIHVINQIVSLLNKNSSNIA